MPYRKKDTICPNLILELLHLIIYEIYLIQKYYLLNEQT